VDYGIVETLELRMNEGRAFAKDFADKDSLILNEAAVKKLQWENPLGKQLVVGDKTGTVIGVAEDFIFADIGFEIPPAVLYVEPENLSVLLVRYSSASGFPDLREYIKEQWAGLIPDQPFECLTMTEFFGRVFGLLDKLTGFLNIIGMTAVFFSCLGLLGLATYLTERRTKEIGIRKVLGASSLNIMWRMTREFLLLVTIANVIALGLVYFGWNKALQTGLLFITPINAGTYILAVSVSLITAFLAVSSQTLKAAWANPVNSLRYE
jgi:putative ABC transport system permease protein